MFLCRRCKPHGFWHRPASCQVSPGVPQLRRTIVHHAHALYNPLVTCIHPGEQVISYQEMCCRNQGAEGSLGSLLPLPKPAIFVRHQVFQEGKLSWWRMWLWRRTGWGLPGVLWSPALWRGVLIIWMPRPSRGNPFDWLITLERVRRSEEGMADKVHWACWMEAKSDWHWPLSPLEVTVAA